ncbi:MAG: sigma-70 family RNA polymerase sigma factor [Clostridia bacterium]|nr:sigma-70 family RNA polymerase sigma factor [Clostridia bacterium]
MEDKRIVDLYWERSETAIAESQKKYGKYCYTIAYNILCDRGDSDECVNDTWLGAWNAMPPAKPQHLASFLGRITRNLSLNRLERSLAQKRGGGRSVLVVEELEDCLPAREGDVTDEIVLRAAINGFLRSLPRVTMIVFLQRYWFFRPIKEIAEEQNLSESNVKVLLHRTRKLFKQYLEEKGIVI